MRSLVVVVALAALVACVSAADIPEEEDVLVLDDSNFDEAIASYDTLLVEFYAPWCGHCKKLAPEYARAAATLKKDGFRIAKMDASVHTVSPGKFDVKGFPTLKFFRGGKASDYGGGRTEVDIVNWVRKKSGPAAKTLTTVEEVDAFTTGAEVAVVGIFDAVDSADAKAFLNTAAGVDEVPFAITTAAAVAAKYAVTAPVVVLIKAFDEGRADLAGPIDADALKTFVSANSLPLVVPFNQKNSPKIFGGSIKSHLLVFVDENSSEYSDIIASVTAVAKEVKGKMLVVSVGNGNDRVSDYFGVKKADMPTSAIVNMPEGGSMKKFLLGHSNVNEATLSAFAASYLSGTIKPFLKSAEAPASQDGPVVVLVGTTFNSIVLDESKDVLVEFYAPWCGHCKTLAPIYDELGEKLSSVKSLVIAKMDATANEIDHPAVNVKGFPTLKFFPAGERKSQVMDYDGARDFAGMMDFLKENAAIPFTVADDESNDEL